MRCFRRWRVELIGDALTDTEKAHFLSLCARSEIDPFATANVELVKSIFGNGSQTVQNLAAARVESISRGADLGLGRIKPGHVQEARTLNGYQHKCHCRFLRHRG